MGAAPLAMMVLAEAGSCPLSFVPSGKNRSHTRRGTKPSIPGGTRTVLRGRGAD